MAVNRTTDMLTPDPLREQPPADRYCDLILNGGVASGVVYPWALHELARHFRFHSIGGNSVGAMAAALGAAAEYGRCNGHEQAFEVLRRAPLELAREQDGRPGMLRLFQPGPGLQGWFDLFEIGVRAAYAGRETKPRRLGSLARVLGHALRGDLVLAAVVAAVVIGKQKSAGLAVATLSLLLLLLSVLAVGVVAGLYAWMPNGWALGAVLAVGAILLVGVALRTWCRRLRALRANGWGLCSGRSQGAEEALIEWLNRGIQLAAGRGEHDAPLSFADLWHARPGAPKGMDGRGCPLEPAIDLQMFSTNVTLGRPVQWPLRDLNTRLFFLPEEWKALFPERLLNAAVAASRPYEPANDSDPSLDSGDANQRGLKSRLLEIPAGGLPIAIAARMSLCFPLLFSCVPVYAIDYEAGQPAQRLLRKCWMSDGGLCTNFPIHLFDAAHPRWPTFGLMLSRRISMPEHEDQSVWLPDFHGDGRADNWNRGVPDAEGEASVKGLPGLLIGMLMAALDWGDNLTSRLPQVRNRVLRMALRGDEGQLNIVMPGSQILRMAHEYGTQGGQLLVRRFADGSGGPSVAWREHLYVRTVTQLRTLRAHLRGYRRSVGTAGWSVPLTQLLAEATLPNGPPLRSKPERPDARGASLEPSQRDALQAAVDAVVALEQALEQLEGDFGPYRPVPTPELKLRAPM